MTNTPYRPGALASPQRRLPYQPALDGIRGLAVAAVLAYHAGLPWARGGFLGVDAFFVLSGYLITSLLLVEWRATGSIDLFAFWARRARRLLPALFLVLAGVAGYAVLFAEPGELGRLRLDALATLGYVANWRSIFAGQSYFDQFAVPSPLLHTWSLAIEEQWYLLWPVLLLLVFRARRLSPVTIAGAALVLAAGSALLMAWLYDPHGDPSRVYYGADTRAQSLLVGAALGAWALRKDDAPPGKREGALQVAALGCAAYIGWMWATASGNSPFVYRGGLFLLALAVAAVIAAAVRPGGPLRAVLSAPPLRGLGLVSYGVYLWHWPVYLVLTPDRVGWDGYGLFAARVLVTLAIAITSYHAIEVPVRRGALRRWRFSWSYAPAAAAALAVLLVLVTRGGAPGFTVATTPAPPMLPSGADELASSRPVRVLLVGDSVAFTMGLGLERVASAWDLSVWNNAKLGCGLLRADAVRAGGEWIEQDGSCHDWPARWRSYVDAFQPDVAVVLIGAWDLADREVGGRVLEFGTPEGQAFALAELDQAADVLSSGGARVVLLTTPHFEQRDLGLNVSNPRFDLSRIDGLNRLYQELLQRRPQDVLVLDLGALVRAAGADGEIEMQNDGVHFTPEGADVVARWLAPQLAQAGNAAVRYRSDVASLSARGSDVMPPPRWLELLGQVPDTSETRSLTIMNDYARYRAVFGVDRPDAGAGDEALIAYYRQLLFAPEGKLSALAPAEATGITTFPPRLIEPRTELGLTIADLDQDIWAGEPAHAIQVLRGRFDRSRVDEALRAGGEPDLVAVSGDGLYLSTTAEGLTSMIDVAEGQRPSLAGDPDFRLLAGALERLDTYTAAFSTDTAPYTVSALAPKLAGTQSAGRAALVWGRSWQEAKLLPFQAFATGAGLDAQGPYMALVLLNADDATALRNARLLRSRIDQGTGWVAKQPFRDFIDSAEITTEARLVLAKIRTGEYRFWYALPAAKETLLLHD